MLGFALADGGDASGLGMLAFLPVGLILLIGIIVVLGPVLPGRADRQQDEPDREEERRGPRRDGVR